MKIKPSDSNQHWRVWRDKTGLKKNPTYTTKCSNIASTKWMETDDLKDTKRVHVILNELVRRPRAWSRLVDVGDEMKNPQPNSDCCHS